MAGPTWLTHPEWGVGALYLEPAWSTACIVQTKLGAVGCTRPVVSVQDFHRSGAAHSATRPAALSTRLAMRQSRSLHIWHRRGHTLLLQPKTAAPMRRLYEE